MNLKQLADRYAEFVPPCAEDGNKEESHSNYYAKVQEKLWCGKKEAPHKVTDKSIDDCICFMHALQEKRFEIREQIVALLLLDFQILDMQSGMCHCFPAEYDGDRLLLAYNYVPVFIEKSEHWTFRHINREEKQRYKDAYLYAKDIWRQLTKTIEGHNFRIGAMGDKSEVLFHFTVSNVPGLFEIHLPIGKKQRQSPSMEIRVSYAMATMEDLWHTICKAYRIEEISSLLSSWVGASGYKEYLPKATIEHKDIVDGKEIIWSETQEIPQSIWDAIERSKQEATVEKYAIID